MGRVNPLLACGFLCTVTFALGQPQRMPTQIQLTRMQSLVLSTPDISIQSKITTEDAKGVQLAVTCGVLLAPEASTFHIVALSSATVNFAGVPTSLKVKAGEYRASGKTGNMKWTIRVNDGGLATAGGWTTYPPQPRVYIKVVDNANKVLLKVGSPTVGAVSDAGSIARISPPAPALTPEPAP